MSDDRLELMDETGQPEATPRKKKRWRDRWLLMTVLGVLIAVLLAAVGAVSWYGKSVFDALNNMDRQPNMLPSDNRPAPVPTPDGEDHAPMNFIVMGTDRREGETSRGRSDVLMVVHVPADRQQVYLVSIPRDYWVDIPGRSTAKINAAYSWGGTPLTVATVESLLDVPIDHLAMTDFEGFTEVIDAVGGVTVYNKHDSENGGVHFPVGEVTLDGDDAILYVRNRYGLPNGDFDRAERQRDVMTAVIEKLVSRDVLTDPAKFRDAVTTLGSQFTVDEGLTNDVMLDLALSMRITGGSDVVSLQAPTAGFGTSSDGQSYVAVDRDRLAELATALRDDTMDAYAAGE